MWTARPAKAGSCEHPDSGGTANADKGYPARLLGVLRRIGPRSEAVPYRPLRTVALPHGPQAVGRHVKAVPTCHFRRVGWCGGVKAYAAKVTRYRAAVGGQTPWTGWTPWTHPPARSARRWGVGGRNLHRIGLRRPYGSPSVAVDRFSIGGYGFSDCRDWEADMIVWCWEDTEPLEGMGWLAFGASSTPWPGF